MRDTVEKMWNLGSLFLGNWFLGGSFLHFVHKITHLVNCGKLGLLQMHVSTVLV